MADCVHDLMEWQHQDEEMHYLSWMCRTCGSVAIGECHHQTWCRVDFCGAEPAAEAQGARRLQPATACSPGVVAR